MNWPRKVRGWRIRNEDEEEHPTPNTQHPMTQARDGRIIGYWRSVLRCSMSLVMLFGIAASMIAGAEEHRSNRYSRELPLTRPQDYKRWAKAEKLMIPKLHFRDAPIRDAFEYLKRMGAGDINFGVNLVLDLRDLDSEPPAISLKLENVNILKALDEVCSKANLYWKIGNRAIVVGSRDDVSESDE
jgi:hypothetical protein